MSEVAGAERRCPGRFEGEELFSSKGERGLRVDPNSRLDLDPQSIRCSIRRAVCRVVYELD